MLNIVHTILGYDFLASQKLSMSGPCMVKSFFPETCFVHKQNYSFPLNPSITPKIIIFTIYDWF